MAYAVARGRDQSTIIKIIINGLSEVVMIVIKLFNTKKNNTFNDYEIFFKYYIQLKRDHYTIFYVSKICTDLKSL